MPSKLLNCQWRATKRYGYWLVIGNTKVGTNRNKIEPEIEDREPIFQVFPLKTVMGPSPAQKKEISGVSRAERKSIKQYLDELELLRRNVYPEDLSGTYHYQLL